MKDKIRTILKEWLQAKGEGDIVFTDDIAIEEVAEEIDALFEVAEMPTEEEIQKHIETTRFMDGTPSMDEQTFYEGAKWFRNRMSKPNTEELKKYRITYRYIGKTDLHEEIIEARNEPDACNKLVDKFGYQVEWHTIDDVMTSSEKPNNCTGGEG